VDMKSVLRRKAIVPQAVSLFPANTVNGSREPEARKASHSGPAV
jgi:hypothetical protein